MFGFGKITPDKDGNLLVTNKSRYVCDLNKYIGQSVVLKFKEDHLIMVFDEDEIIMEYARIVSCGKIANTRRGSASPATTTTSPATEGCIRPVMRTCQAHMPGTTTSTP